MADNTNNATNVATGKPKVSGAIYRALLSDGLVLPTDPTTALPDDFKCMGFVSEDGVTNGRSSQTEEFKEWGGNVVYSSLTSQADTFKFKLVEVLNPNVLKSVYGEDAVDTDLSGNIKIAVSAKDLPYCAWVIETMLNGRAKRIVIPNAKVSEVADIVYKANELMGYDTTLSASPDAEGNTHYEYIAA